MPQPSIPRTFRQAGPRWLVTVAAATMALTALTPAAAADQLSTVVAPEVYAALTTSDTTEFLVYLSETADLSAAATLSDRDDRLEYVHQRLTTVAETSQADLRTELDRQGVEYQAFWVVNALLVAGDRQLVEQLATRPEVAYIEPNHRWTLPKPEATPLANVTTTDWNIQHIRADQVWEEFGVTGEGVTLASIDTGVAYQHPALVNQYRGNRDGSFDHNYHWFDPSGTCAAAPCDNVGHGTHLTGTMVGDDGANNQIGVAPGATWIAAKGCVSFSCSSSHLLSAGQWMLAPTDVNGSNADPSKAPHVVLNAWGGGSGTWFLSMINAWISAGIFPVFAAGGSGPACGTITMPSAYPGAYAVGAHDSNGLVAPFSARGAPLDAVVNPDVTAPGINIRSAVPNNGYAIYSGTSMAAAHVAGTAALVASAYPTSSIPGLIDAGAQDVNDLTCGGTPGDNNVYGEGLLDAYAAILAGP
jgi:subtilisin family serine protease